MTEVVEHAFVRLVPSLAGFSPFASRETSDFKGFVENTGAI